jgi:hypothetical protein
VRVALPGYDFYYQWLAGSLVRAGANPYALESYREGLQALGWPPGEVTLPLTHPPTTLWLYWLAAALPFRAALWLWLFGWLVACLACARVLAPLLTRDPSVSGRLAVLAAVAFPPVLSNLIWGQVNGILLLGLTGFARAWSRGRLLAAGLALSLVAFKPQTFVPFLVVVVLGEIKRGRGRLLGGLACGVLVQAFASFLLSPDSFRWYLEYVPGFMHRSSHICGASVGQMLACEFGATFARPLLPLAGALGALLLTARYGYSPPTLLCLLVPLSAITSPYAWSHSFVVLVPALLTFLRAALDRATERALIYGLVALGVFSLLAIRGFNIRGHCSRSRCSRRILRSCARAPRLELPDRGPRAHGLETGHLARFLAVLREAVAASDPTPPVAGLTRPCRLVGSARRRAHGRRTRRLTRAPRRRLAAASGRPSMRFPCREWTATMPAGASAHGESHGPPPCRLFRPVPLVPRRRLR